MVGLIEEQNVEANFMANKNLSFGFTPEVEYFKEGNKS